MFGNIVLNYYKMHEYLGLTFSADTKLSKSVSAMSLIPITIIILIIITISIIVIIIIIIKLSY